MGAPFYERGIRAVGVDLIADEVGTTKKTLYDRLGSKDELVAASRALFVRLVDEAGFPGRVACHDSGTSTPPWVVSNSSNSDAALSIGAVARVRGRRRHAKPLESRQPWYASLEGSCTAVRTRPLPETHVHRVRAGAKLAAPRVGGIWMSISTCPG
jgi:hypothetical protein